MNQHFHQEWNNIVIDLESRFLKVKEVEIMTQEQTNYQERVKQEKQELDSKLGKLLSFFSNPLFRELPTVEKELLTEQSKIMGAYSAVLGKRIALFP